MQVIKASGEKTVYDPEKIVRSLRRVGADEKVIKEVLSETEKEIFNGINTKTLYKIVFKNLRRLMRNTAGKYHLKQAIMELGPSGFPFEKFISALLEQEGYQTSTNQIVQGQCVTHEIDVIAQKDNKHLMIECKFHGNIGTKSDIKHALYVYARFLDVRNNWVKLPNHATKIHEGWLVTNTRLTSDAEKYGQCVGLGCLSWNLPHKNSLRERIDRRGLYPITCLTTISSHEKKKLLHRDIVLCRTLCERPSLLKVIGLSETRKTKVLDEAESICKWSQTE